ncbi:MULTISPECIES: hypothetical protein [unclassified Sphingomonas]|uniref:hypothetical protein n=1 Tax=unclassified Sphingomonas TaxID=196159 RepID=UPI0007011649|nr:MULTISPECIES: hypothetical protein [unclassified Sphingomonas]KQX18436.1 hypothetical protein ASD17_14840 [Sphingomonas sp. Root1294]KQY72239.1 hypothetical protein ASD39_20135 [Sphingomonas sp. Root50]KRB94490.1 hypothetical protein ASE22_00615 [Sphingomonas sp. Root720]
MHRLHLDDLQYMMEPAHFAYLKRWLEKHGALIVRPDDVREAHRSMGNFASRPGRWGEDEPYPPYAGTRKLFEDARDTPPPGKP